MNIPVRSRPQQLNLTPLIDIVFLLLVFFLLTTHFIEEDGLGVRLPAAASTVEHRADDLVVTITRDGEIFFRGRRLGLGDLTAALAAGIGGGTATVVVRGDRELDLQTAVAVMESAQRAGAAKIVVATLGGGGEAP